MYKIKVRQIVMSRIALAMSLDGNYQSENASHFKLLDGDILDLSVFYCYYYVF